MKRLNCPLNGPRNISEFVFGGEVKALPAPDCTNAQWVQHVFYATNTAGLAREWWLHQASGYWFIAERNRTTDEVERTFDPAELYPAPLYFPGEHIP